MKTSELNGDTGRKNGTVAVGAAVDHGLPVSPQNYELFLHYKNDWTPGLKDEVERSLASNGQLDEKDAETLYGKYFSNSLLSSKVIETGDRLAAELSLALKALRAAGKRTSAFSDDLDAASDALDSGRLDAGQIAKLIASLSEATKEMSRENEELSKRLESSSSEVDQLRDHLQQARAESLTDALTGVANRKSFDENLSFRITEARKNSHPLILALCDIDHFKSFNDTWGHQTGDQVIRFVATTLNRLALKDQLVARYGGEEFAVIMPRIEADEAAALLERMRQAIEAKQLMRRSTNEALGNVTVSFGFAMLQPNMTSTDLISIADQCLYRSKALGRNRVTSEAEFKAAAA